MAVPKRTMPIARDLCAKLAIARLRDALQEYDKTFQWQRIISDHVGNGLASLESLGWLQLTQQQRHALTLHLIDRLPLEDVQVRMGIKKRRQVYDLVASAIETMIQAQATETYMARLIPHRPRRLLRYRENIPGSVREQVYDRDGRQCVLCGSEDNLSLDHIIPLARGGREEMSNYQTLCRPCNSRKHMRPWLA